MKLFGGNVKIDMNEELVLIKELEVQNAKNVYDLRKKQMKNLPP